MRDGLEKVEGVPESHFDRKTRQEVLHTYEGDPIPLGYLDACVPEPMSSLWAPRDRKPFHPRPSPTVFCRPNSSCASWKEDGEIKSGELEGRLKTPNDFLRNYLAREVLPADRDNFSRGPGGRFHAALYELED